MEGANHIFVFEAPLETFPDYGMSGIVFPYSVEKAYGKRGQVRVCVEMLGLSLRRSLIPLGAGEHFLIVNKEMRRKHKLEVGDPVAVKLWLDPEPMEAEMPEELAVVLEMEPHARAFYEQLNLSTRRQMGIWIDQAKRPETRANRAANILNRLLQDHMMWGGREIRRK